MLLTEYGPLSRAWERYSFVDLQCYSDERELLNEHITMWMWTSSETDLPEMFGAWCWAGALPKSVQQRTGFPRPKKCLSLKYPKRGMSHWLQFHEMRYQWTLLSIQRWHPLAVLDKNQKSLLIGRTFSLSTLFWVGWVLFMSLHLTCAFWWLFLSFRWEYRVSFSVRPFSKM